VEEESFPGTSVSYTSDEFSGQIAGQIVVNDPKSAYYDRRLITPSNPVVQRVMASTPAINGTPAPGKTAGADYGKKAAAYFAVDSYVRSGQVLGVGTGSTAQYLVERIGEKFQAGQLESILCVPSSAASRALLIQKGLPISDLDRTPALDICIDGADEIDPFLNCIKGGGGCLLQEKIVQSCSARFVLIADSSKQSGFLGQKYIHVPVEVLPMACVPVKAEIEKAEGGECWLRMATKKAGPVITDNGNYILDWEFPKVPEMTTADWTSTHARIKLIPGVIETGLFTGVAEAAVFGQPNGEITTVFPQPSQSE
jgi:ribose 5-phosphate isomerase A